MCRSPTLEVWNWTPLAYENSGVFCRNRRVLNFALKKERERESRECTSSNETTATTSASVRQVQPNNEPISSASRPCCFFRVFTAVQQLQQHSDSFVGCRCPWNASNCASKIIQCNFSPEMKAISPAHSSKTDPDWNFQ